jgi:hypothetical protein
MADSDEEWVEEKGVDTMKRQGGVKRKKVHRVNNHK